MTNHVHEHRAERVALIGTYVPNQCGIATFGADVVAALSSASIEARVIAIEDTPGSRSYPDEVALIVEREDHGAYVGAARFINLNEFDAIVVEHEFGIFGGPDGAHIVTLLEHARVPAIVTLHTILEAPTEGQARVMRSIDRLAERFVVMTEKGAEILARTYGSRRTGST